MLKTEMRNERTTHIDKMEIAEMVDIITDENKNAVLAVEKENAQIVKAIELAVDSFQKGGSLFYVGAGTSGRLGVVDAAECPPTY
ncbi:MAG: N-acetylmuramic acid 6-phosphate etherase, partial [Candidatus Scatosoma sp.]